MGDLVEKKGLEKDPSKMVDMERVEINTRNVRLVEEVFSADEEVQVRLLVVLKTSFAIRNLFSLYL